MLISQTYDRYKSFDKNNLMVALGLWPKILSVCLMLVGPHGLGVWSLSSKPKAQNVITFPFMVRCTVFAKIYLKRLFKDVQNLVARLVLL